jgi:hypothetical protein
LQETIEAKIKDYERALDSAAGFYREIQRLVTTQSNDYNLDVMKRLTTATINFRNTVEQTGAHEILLPISALWLPLSGVLPALKVR